VHLAFAFITLFTFSMVGLGAFSLHHRREQAGIFLAATLISMVGTLVTTMAVMGLLPFNKLNFRAVEAGVMLEAAIWALALGLRLRRQREDGVRALELAQRDPLTGLHNRRGFLEQALPVFATAARNARPVSAVVIDIDHFKRINDRHGHAGGDRTLVDVAERIRNACRSGDIVARWGGEEFVMLLPETDSAQACALAERLREAFAEAPVRVGEDVGEGEAVTITASFGVAVREGPMSLDQLLQAADSALYRAKDAGRDCVVCSAVSGVAL
jgi:diguanylate cyclase (GGDEF)-like protein